MHSAQIKTVSAFSGLEGFLQMALNLTYLEVAVSLNSNEATIFSRGPAGTWKAEETLSEVTLFLIVFPPKLNTPLFLD